MHNLTPPERREDRAGISVAVAQSTAVAIGKVQMSDVLVFLLVDRSSTRYHGGSKGKDSDPPLGFSGRLNRPSC